MALKKKIKKSTLWISIILSVVTVVNIALLIVVLSKGGVDDGEKFQATTEIKLTDSNIELDIGEEYIIVPIAYPENATQKDFKFSSSDESVVEVDELAGKITARDEGNASIIITIRAASEINSLVSATFSVTVVDADKPLTDAQNLKILELRDVINTYELIDYEPAERLEIIAIEEKYKEIIESLTDIEEVKRFLFTDAVSELDAVLTKVEVAEKELAEMRVNLLAEADLILAYYNEIDYSEANWNIMLGMISDIKNLINSATSENEMFATVDLNDLTLNLADVLNKYEEEEIYISEEKEKREIAITNLKNQYLALEAEYAPLDFISIIESIDAMIVDAAEIETISAITVYDREYAAMIIEIEEIQTLEEILAEEKLLLLEIVDEYTADLIKYSAENQVIITAILEEMKAEVAAILTIEDLRVYEEGEYAAKKDELRNIDLV